MRRLQKVAGPEERPVLKRKLWGKGEGSLRLLNHLRRMAGLKERGEKMERDNQRRRQNFTTTSVIKSQRPAQQTVILIEVCPSCETTTKNVSSVQRITSVLRGGRLEETCVILGGTDPRTVFFIYIIVHICAFDCQQSEVSLGCLSHPKRETVRLWLRRLRIWHTVTLKCSVLEKDKAQRREHALNWRRPGRQ